MRCQFLLLFTAHIAQGIPTQQQAPPPHAHAHPSQVPPSTSSYQQQPMTYAAYPPAVTGNLTTQGEVISHAGQTIITGPSAGWYPRTRQAFSPQPALVRGGKAVLVPRPSVCLKLSCGESVLLVSGCYSDFACIHVYIVGH